MNSTSAVRTPHSAFPAPPSPFHAHHSALLLVGATGSGKTPLGQYLEKHGLNGRKCVHFDFGERMRQAARSGRVSALPARDLAIIRQSLKACRLLKAEEFPVALHILQLFLKRTNRNKLVILNGLPRCKSQAAGVADVLRVEAVVVLDCSDKAVHERIKMNSGGDRTGRSDDSQAEIRKKLSIYRKMTLPLIGYYRRKNSGIIRIKSAAGAGSAGMARLLSERMRGATWL